MNKFIADSVSTNRESFDKNIDQIREEIHEYNKKNGITLNTVTIPKITTTTNIKNENEIRKNELKLKKIKEEKEIRDAMRENRMKDKKILKETSTSNYQNYLSKKLEESKSFQKWPNLSNKLKEEKIKDYLTKLENIKERNVNILVKDISILLKEDSFKDTYVKYNMRKGMIDNIKYIKYVNSIYILVLP